ncbi:MAG: Rhodanese domain-containing protein [uncultured Sulfurovum sp.]|uniref:Rhodanese domain-containing protein n=1 Tax=uncultured Sulfurovum sp. TaxID=269237 RepID=A0A6S6SJ87_9BACT|nr:MAG: Rhodanese domain-containing protein [uncultured Sulfurovum sp.]
MHRIIFIMTLYFSILFSDNLLGKLQKNGLTITDEHNKTILIERDSSPLCNDELIRPNALFGDEFAGRRVPTLCKKTFVTKIGVLQPISIGKGIQTVGELEVLLHIKNAQENPNDYILLDARAVQWFDQMRIPTAVNLPFNKINYVEDKNEDDFDSMDEYKVYLEQVKKIFNLLNIVETDKGLDFTKAKSVLVYCNGSWCSQSPHAVYKLINMGYPKEKILWYRGGLQDWLIYDYTVTKGKG